MKLIDLVKVWKKVLLMSQASLITNILFENNDASF